MLQVLVWFWKFLLRLLGIRPGNGGTQVDYVVGRMDQNFQNMRDQLEKVSSSVVALEKGSASTLGQLNAQLQAFGKQTEYLTHSTRTLREALASSRARGQWGERMAEDILRLMGFVEDINYQKQATMDGGRSRPDFVFLLPNNLKLNMDVKFPLDNYLRYLEAEAEADKEVHQKDFLRDVRHKIGEVAGRDYIDPEQGTVDYVLLFIPNESVYAFIHECDSDILDMALRQKVIWCSPLTLYAVLAVVRQAVENFALRQTSDEIVSLIGAFNKQWEEFNKSMGTLGNRISTVQKEFDNLSGRRHRALQRPLNRIENLRTQRGLPVAVIDDTLPPDAESRSLSPGSDLDEEE